jgi:hypothetical protein
MIDSAKRIGMLTLVICALIGISALTYVVYNTFIKEKGFYVNTNGTAVVKEIQKLQRLETSAFTIEKIIDAGTTGNKFQQFLYGDKILLIANGQVIAGFDFSKMTEKDIIVNGQSIIVNMPAPMVLFTRLDSSKTRVYDRSTGILSKGERDLESEARAQAEITIRQAACEGGILDSAEENGRKQMTSLMAAIGFQDITINIPKGQCQ